MNALFAEPDGFLIEIEGVTARVTWLGGFRRIMLDAVLADRMHRAAIEAGDGDEMNDWYAELNQVRIPC